MASPTPGDGQPIASRLGEAVANTGRLCSYPGNVWRYMKEFNMAAKLGIGDAFPPMELPLVGGGSITLPSDQKTTYSVILFYRGHW